MKKYFSIILFLLLIPAFVWAEGEQNNQVNQSEKKKALLFYAQDCPFCDEVEKYFQDEKLYEKYEIKQVNVSGEYNMQYLNEFYDAFGVIEEKRGWPAIFFGKDLLVGSQPIIKNFTAEMEKNGTTEFPVPGKKEELKKETQKTFDGTWKTFLPLIFTSSLAESAGPGMLAGIVFFALVFWPLVKKRKDIFSAIFFLAGVFIVRIFFEFLIFRGLDIFRVQFLLVFAGIFAISLGIFSVLFPIDDSYLILLRKIKIKFFSERINYWIKSFCLGIVTGIFLIPAKISPLVSFLKILEEDLGNFKKITGLLIYAFLFIIPIVVVVGSFYFLERKKIYFAKSKKRIRSWRMALGVAMILAGVFIIKISF